MVSVDVQEAGGRLPIRGREGQRRGSPHHGGVSVNHFTWQSCGSGSFFAVFRIRIRIDRIRMFWGLLDPDPDQLVSCGSGFDIGQVMVSVPVSVPDPNNRYLAQFPNNKYPVICTKSCLFNVRPSRAPFFFQRPLCESFWDRSGASLTKWNGAGCSFPKWRGSLRFRIRNTGGLSWKWDLN